MVIFSKLDAVLRKMLQEDGSKRKALHMNNSEIILINIKHISNCVVIIIQNPYHFKAGGIGNARNHTD